MSKKTLSPEQKRLDTDIWIIALVTLAVFCLYAAMGNQLTQFVLDSGFPLSVLGMAVIILVWGFFEGFNYAVISEKINRRYPPAGLWLDMGAVICAAACLLLHPFNTSFWGIVELITTFTAIYGMLIVKRQTGNAWGCVFAFCFIWNAF